jgi:hypothetical protein
MNLLGFEKNEGKVSLFSQNISQKNPEDDVC